MTSREISQIFKSITHNLNNCNDKIELSINNMLIGGNSDEKSYKKMKKFKYFVNQAQNSILYFKALAEYYYRMNLLTTTYYQGVVQKMQEMKQKMVGMDSKVQNIATQYQHNSEKIQMLEYFVDMIEKMAKNPAEIDLNLKSNLNNKMVEYQTNTSMNFGDVVNTIKQFDLNTANLQNGGGEKTFEELEQIITANEEAILNSFSNIEFLNKKMTSLNERMKQVVDNNDSLFKLRAEVEWVVNTLENCADGTCDSKAVSHNFDKLWKIVNGIQEKIKGGETFDAKIVEYISGLEKYIGVLETQLNSADRTLKALDTKNEETMQTHVKNLESELNKKSQTGGLLMEEQYEKENEKRKNINENIDLKYINCEFTLKDAENKEYAQFVVLKTIIKTLNEVIEQFYELCSKNKEFYNEENTVNFFTLWKDTFKSKKTSYYLDLLEKTIAYQNDTILAKNFTLPDDTFKIIIKMESSKELENLITLLENTKSFYICANYVNAKYAMGIMIMNQDDNSKNEEQMQNLNVMLKEYGNNLHKATHLTFDNFSESYDDTMKGGGLPYMHILPMEEINELKKITALPDTYSPMSFDMYTEFTTAIKENPDMKTTDILPTINKNVMLKIKNIEDNIEGLYEMILNKLGQTNKSYRNLTKGLMPDNTIDLVTIASKFGVFETKQSGGKMLLGGAEKEHKPRLDPFKLQLVKCQQMIEDFAGQLINLKEWMKRNASGKLEKSNNNGQYNSLASQSKLLLQIQKKIDSTVVSGRNSYIKVIPMIFFIVEFPPHIYLNNSVKDFYKFTYADQKIKRTHYLENGSEEVTEYNGAHAAFFASNNKNGTSYLLKDPLIGLDKVISVDSEIGKPINKVINMMFALGASGTGKTTRYFGKSDAPDKNDKQGVVSFIIENAKSIGNPEVNVAYFVCYGQHDGTKTGSLDELVIFFNNDKDGSNKYMPYNMKVNKTEKITGYTNFYIQLMNKKLNKLTYANIEDFLQGKVNNIKESGNEFGSFRKIIEDDKDIWMKPSTTPEEITKLFETLIGEQKKIFTVMPTKNNIESSRGHTCVLIRFKYDDGTIKYFPLFDMAGTEDPKEVKEFFNTFKYIEQNGTEKTMQINKLKLAKLMKQINLAHDSISDEINGKETILQSLTDLLSKSEKARKYVGLSGNLMGGSTKVEDLIKTTEADKSILEAEKFLEKLGKEGYYINHTIAMLIFATMCVGTSLNTTQIGDVDNFDGFEEALNNELQSNYICLLDKEIQGCSNTRFILDKYGFAEILSKSCIWTQILFSFLYWNQDTQESYDKLCKQIHNDYNNKEKIKLLTSQMTYFVAKHDEIKNNCNIELFIKDDVVYNNAIKLCELLENSLLSNVKVSNNGITFVGNSQNYEVYVKNNYVSAKKILTDEKQVEVYIGAHKNSTLNTLNKLLKNNKPIESIANLTEENVNAITDDKNSQKFNILTYNLYRLSEEFERVVNSELPKNITTYEQAINFDPEITKYINKIFLIDDNNNYMTAIHSPIIGQPNKYSIEKKSFSNVDKLTLLVKPISTDYNSITNQTMGIKLNEKQQKFITYSISKILKYFGNPPNKKNLESNVQKINNAKIDNIIKLFSDANINKDSYNLVLLSAEKSLKDIKTSLAKSLEFSKSVSMLIENGKNELNNFKGFEQEYNQMKRIKDGSVSATKMTLMHLVTGQTYKAKMVQNTLELCQTLYNSTDLKL